MNDLIFLMLLGALFSSLSFVIPKVFPKLQRWMVGETISRTESEIIEDGAAVFEAHNITPLWNFDWKITEPLKFRPFKPRYHLTMGLTNTPISSLLEMDKNYLTRLDLRKQIIASHPDIAIQASPAVKQAVDELYTWLVNIYLPTRFPTMFALSTYESTLNNHATCLSIPLTPPLDSFQTLRILGENIDEDFLIMLPDEKGDGYRLQGYVTCFPSGFNTKEKFGLKLREIHGPVPGYKEKLELSMDRFFDRVEVGRCVGRSNWAITTNDRLFTPGGTHLYEGETAAEEEVIINNTYLRSERQTLHRLPKSKALVFAFKTYLYPLQEIKDEGSGEILAAAIDGLKSGSVPEIHFYKRGVVWGEKVKEFLRS